MQNVAILLISVASGLITYLASGGQLFIGQTAKLHLKWLSVFQSIG